MYARYDKKEGRMKNNSKAYSIINTITLTLLLICIVLGGGSEIYLFVKYHGEPIIYANMQPIDQKIFNSIFVCLLISAGLMIPFVFILLKADNPPLNYTVVDKDEYQNMQKHMVNQEYENMKQDVEISRLKVRLSSLKLKFKIWKKIFKHKK